MCGIFALLGFFGNKKATNNYIINAGFDTLKERGPEYSILKEIERLEAFRTATTTDKVSEEDIYFGFHRLAINGLDEKSHQPIINLDCALICNGEIYNFRELYKHIKVPDDDIKTNTDCEVIIHLYRRYGIRQALTMLDGVFSFVLYDYVNDSIFMGRDPFGVRPLFILPSIVVYDPNSFDYHNRSNPYVNATIIASEQKAITTILSLCEKDDAFKDIIPHHGIKSKIVQVKPSHFYVWNRNPKIYNVWCPETRTYTPKPIKEYEYDNEYNSYKINYDSSFSYQDKKFKEFRYFSLPAFYNVDGRLNVASFKHIYDIGKYNSQKPLIEHEHGHGHGHGYGRNKKTHKHDTHKNVLDRMELIDMAQKSLTYEDRNVFNQISYGVFQTLNAAVKKRVDAADRPIACLLSGGLDSSTIAALVNRHYTAKTGGERQLETFSIGFEGSEDLKYSCEVAEYLGTKHTQIVVSEETFINAIPEVIKAIESFDTTSVRASVGNYLVAKYIKEHSDAKVIFNGDGVLALHRSSPGSTRELDEYAFDMECKRLLNNIHYFDVLRSDRSISSHGLEPRTPFLDKTFVAEYLKLDPRVRAHTILGKGVLPEKFLLRMAISLHGHDETGVYPNFKPLLPKKVVWRTKEAFSDGVSSHSRSWYQIVQENAPSILEGLNDIVPFNELKMRMKHYIIADKDINTYTDLANNILKFQDIGYMPPMTLEQAYYRILFEYIYGYNVKTLPYFWMPRFVKNATDASARTLDIYKEILAD